MPVSPVTVTEAFFIGAALGAAVVVLVLQCAGMV